MVLDKIRQTLWVSVTLSFLLIALAAAGYA